MKRTLQVMLALLSVFLAVPAFSEEASHAPAPETGSPPEVVKPAGAVAGDAPLADLPNLSVRLKKGDVAPFDGRLIETAEHVRRERINERNAGFVEHASTQVIISKPKLIALIVGCALASAAVSSVVIVGAYEIRKR